MDHDSHFHEGLRHHVEGRLDSAENIYREVLEKSPGHADALHHLGLIHLQLGAVSQAIGEIQSSLEAEPRSPSALANLGYCLNLVDDRWGASAACKAALELDPDNDGAWTNLGNAQRGLEFFDEAMCSYERALTLCPSNPRYIYNVGLALFDQNEFQRAKEYLQRCLAIDPNIPEAQNNLCACLLKLHDPLVALGYADRAIALKPDYAEAWSNRGNALGDLRRHEEALASFDRAIALKPDYAEAWLNRGNALGELRRHEDALASCDRAIALKPDANYILGDLVHRQMKVCDWTDLDGRCQTLESRLLAGDQASNPFPILSLFNDPPLQRQCAEIWSKNKLGFTSPLHSIGKRGRRDKIRVGYFSMDFREHPVAHLMAELIETHDRNRFEIFGFSFGIETGDSMRKRLEGAFDKFLEVSLISELDIARLARDHEIDIAIDLGGYTQDSRPAIFAHRAAPIQINYLGFPGTMGTEHLDYFIGDRVTVTQENIEHFSEKIIFLPNSFQANPSSRPIGSRESSRASYGLPESGLVFCCFNNVWKITPDVFKLWASILQKVKGSVLWLQDGGDMAKKNLSRELESAGIGDDRIVFAGRLPWLSDHLSRYRLADLFLDTFPYGAHTTASDSLWAGLPVLTRTGESFASRVASSLLHAIGLPELITHTTQEYESLAIELANNPEKLSSFKARLAENRATCPLFNTALFTQHIEAAYQAAYDRYHEGLAPDHIYVSA